MKLTAAFVLTVMILGCGGSSPPQPVADRAAIDAIIATIEAADGDWDQYVRKAKALHAIGHIKIADLSADGYYGTAKPYAPGQDAPWAEWIALDATYIQKDPCTVAGLLVHELAHLVRHTYLHGGIVDEEPVRFRTDCKISASEELS